MNELKINGAIEHLKHFGHLHIEEDAIFLDGFLGGLQHTFNLSYHTSQTEKIVAFIKDLLNRTKGDVRQDTTLFIDAAVFDKSIAEGTMDEKKNAADRFFAAGEKLIQSTSEAQNVLSLADAFIERYGSNKSDEKILKAFDRQVRAYRKGGEYIHKSNSDLLKKWNLAQQPEKIFHKFPEFVDYLNSSKLLSQIATTRDVLLIGDHEDDEPMMLLEGRPTKASDIMKRFTIQYSEEYEDIFVIDETSSVYTYLDNGKGLQKFHPFLTVLGPPIAVLDENSLKCVQEHAKKFVRYKERSLSPTEKNALDENRHNVFQIVTATLDRRDPNYNAFYNPPHAYMRLVFGQDLSIYKKGDVYEFGFHSKKMKFPSSTTIQGSFCSLDPSEYTLREAVFVTNIPITDEEASRVLTYTSSLHRRALEFNHNTGLQAVEHDSTVFVLEIAKQAGIEILAKT